MPYKNKWQRDKPLYILIVVGVLVVIYLALCMAPFMDDGLIVALFNAENISFLPRDITWVENTPKTILICTFAYLIAVAVGLSYKRRLHRSGVEEGSSDWANISALRQEFNSVSPERIVYTEHFAISVAKEDVFKHNRNYNTMVIGGPGSRKTTGYVYPNLLEAHGSYVVLDPKGEVCANTATYMLEHNYKVKVLNLLNPYRSWGYNPFKYIRSDTDDEKYADDDIQKIVTGIFKATTVPNSQTIDPFWDKAGEMLLSALMYLVYYFGAENEKNFSYIMNLIRACRREGDDDDDPRTPLDILFEGIEEKYPDHICVRYYKNATSGAGNTMKSVIITLLARLQKFELASINEMMSNDELELEKLGEEPTVLYCIIPDNDTSYNFIVSLLYIQLFQTLYDLARVKYNGRLPQFVHIIMDEFANVEVPDDFKHYLATCRSRNIGISIIIQAIAQLKIKYKEGYEDLLGQCDATFYLGSNEPSAHDLVSKMLGKETIDTTNYGRRYGMHGDASTNYQFKGRELLTPDEVRTLPYEYALLFIAHSPPIIDRKINVFKYKKAFNTAIRGNDSKIYEVPLRHKRFVSTSGVKPDKATKQPSIYELTAVGDNDSTILIEFNISGKSYISESAMFELVQSYTVDLDDINNFLID